MFTPNKTTLLLCSLLLKYSLSFTFQSPLSTTKVGQNYYLKFSSFQPNTIKKYIPTTYTPLLSTTEDTTSTLSSDSSPSSSDEKIGAWIPIHSASSLYGLGPTQITVMGQRYVVWHSEAEEEIKFNENRKKKKTLNKKKINLQNLTWSVMKDACPHRLAPLSQGRVSGNCIECPYHGWTFDTDGVLTSIPQLESEAQMPNKNGSTKGNVEQSLPVRVVGDLIFAFIPSSVHGEMFQQSLIPENQYNLMKNMKSEKSTFFVRDLPYSADFLIENFMDPAHIPFAHHGLQGVRDDGSSIPMKTLVSNFTHVEVFFKDKVRDKKRLGVLSFQRPCLYHFRTLQADTKGKKKAEKKEALEKFKQEEKEIEEKKDLTLNDTLNFKMNLGIFIVPISHGKTRVLFQSAFVDALPTWLIHAASNRFLNTDTWLHDAEIEARSRSEVAEEYIYTSESDKATVVFRNWWRKFGFSKSPPHTFGPAPRDQLPLVPLSRALQIDPWLNHAKTCSDCRDGLKLMKKGQKVGTALSSASFIALSYMLSRVGKSSGNPLMMVIGASIGVGSGYWLNSFCKKFATAIEGNPHQSGIADRSVSAMT